VGNPVQTIFEVRSPHTGEVHRVVGNRPHRIVLDGGVETIADSPGGTDGRSLLDLPRIEGEGRTPSNGRHSLDNPRRPRFAGRRQRHRLPRLARRLETDAAGSAPSVRHLGAART
jgi:hypothetical protein